LFNNQIPEQAMWEDTEEIINICNFLGRHHILHHTFLPSGGGLDLHGAGASAEPGCVELYFNDSGRSANIIKPDRLIFQSFGAPYDWAYFRLETKMLRPSGVYENHQGLSEELTEITRGNYEEKRCWNAGSYGLDDGGNELPLPTESRLITRHFSGSFVISARGSVYNALSDTYDGRHSSMSTEGFREYIKLLINVKNESPNRAVNLTPRISTEQVTSNLLPQ